MKPPFFYCILVLCLLLVACGAERETVAVAPTAVTQTTPIPAATDTPAATETAVPTQTASPTLTATAVATEVPTQVPTLAPTLSTEEIKAEQATEILAKLSQYSTKLSAQDFHIDHIGYIEIKDSPYMHSLNANKPDLFAVVGSRTIADSPFDLTNSDHLKLIEDELRDVWLETPGNGILMNYEEEDVNLFYVDEVRQVSMVTMTSEGVEVRSTHVVGTAIKYDGNGNYQTVNLMLPWPAKYEIFGLEEDTLNTGSETPPCYYPYKQILQSPENPKLTTVGDSLQSYIVSDTRPSYNINMEEAVIGVDSLHLEFGHVITNLSGKILFLSKETNVKYNETNPALTPDEIMRPNTADRRELAEKMLPTPINVINMLFGELGFYVGYAPSSSTDKF